MATKSNIQYNEDTSELLIVIPDWIVEEYNLEPGDPMYWEEIEDEIFTVALNNH